MANLIKAAIIFTFGFAVLARISDALDKRHRPSGSPTASLAAGVVGAQASADFRTKEERAESGMPEAPEPDPQPLAAPKVRPTGSYAEVCASFDVVARPEEVIDVLEYASDVTGTPVDALFAVWQKETGYLHGDGRMSGGCDIKSELGRRDRAARTSHWSAMLDMADAFGWKKRYGQDLERMTCSCPSKDKETGLPKGYGGCCGPFQFSGAEVAHQYAIPLGLDPMTFCGGALIAGWELKKHHDNAFKRPRGGGLSRGERVLARYADHPTRKYTRELAAWHAAMSRYYGADTDDRYGYTAVTKWETFYAWQLEDRRQPGYLVSKILGLRNTKYSLRKLRAMTTYASN